MLETRGLRLRSRFKQRRVQLRALAMGALRRLAGRIGARWPAVAGQNEGGPIVRIGILTPRLRLGHTQCFRLTRTTFQMDVERMHQETGCPVIYSPKACNDRGCARKDK